MATAQTVKQNLAGKPPTGTEPVPDVQDDTAQVPGTEIVPITPGPRNPLAVKVEYAKLLAAAGLLPPQYRGKPANLLWAVEYGEMLGLSPMAAITGVHVIEGKPTASAGLISALVRRAGHRLRIKGDDASATCTIIRSDDPDEPFVVTWTMDRAKQAGLTGKDVWKKYPAAMLKARAITECARDACEEALSGVHYTAEELGAEVDEGGAPLDVDLSTGEIHDNPAPTTPAAATTASPVGVAAAGPDPSPAQRYADQAANTEDVDLVKELGRQARADELLDATVNVDGSDGPLGQYLKFRVNALDNIVDADIVPDGLTVDDARQSADEWVTTGG